MVSSPLALLAAEAGAHDAMLLSMGDDAAEYMISLLLLDGRETTWRIVLMAEGEFVRVREQAGGRLPRHCPIRHINMDASFCTGWSGHEDKRVLDAPGAVLWWGKLLQFLRLQERAARLRRWPDRRVWAHGITAAAHQKRAEACAARLGRRFLSALEWSRIELSRPLHRNSANGPSIALALDGNVQFRVWADHPRLVNMRQPCICDAGGGHRRIAMKGCGKGLDGSHADAAVSLIASILAQEEAEREFWRSLAGRRCCGTMDSCPLATNAKSANDENLESVYERDAA